MSIATAIQNAQQKVADAYTAVSSKGGTLPQTKDLSNLPTAINSISGGSFIGIPREVSQEGVYGFPQTDYTFTLPANVKSLGSYAFYYAFYNQSHLIEAIFNIENINSSQTFQNAFLDCSRLTTFRSTATEATGYQCFATAFKYCSSFKNFLMPNLKKVGNGFAQAFEGVTSIEQFELPSLEEIINGYAFSNTFSGCTNLKTASFPKLKKFSGSSSDSGQFYNCFNACTSLTSVNLNSLEEIPRQRALQQTFKGCTSLTTLSFPSLKSTSFGSYTNQFNNMLQNVTGCTVHFPSNLQSVIGSWTDVTAGFGGTNTTVLFDLPATE